MMDVCVLNWMSGLVDGETGDGPSFYACGIVQTLIGTMHSGGIHHGSEHG